MKILQVCPAYYPSIGGVEEHVRNISEIMAKNNEVTVFTTDCLGKLQKEEVINSVCIRRFKSWAPNYAYFVSRELKKQLIEDSDSFDVVHAHSYHTFTSLYAAQAKGRNPFVFTPHYIGGGGTPFRNFLHAPYRLLGKRIFEAADKIVCVSRYERELIKVRFKIGHERTVFIPNGVNSQEFPRLKRRKKKHKVILTVARLEKYKGVQFLIEALPKLDKDIILEIVGRGKYKNSLVNLTRKLNVRERVRFLEGLEKKELLKKYANADIFALLSKREAMPISLIEALAARTPCIVSDIPFLEEWVDNVNCFAVHYPANIDELVSLINKVICKRIQTVEILDWHDVVERLEEVYNSIQKHRI